MKTTDALGCVGWALFILIVASWVPFIGPFVSLLTPLPFLYYATKLGFWPGVKLAALVTITMGLFARLSGYPQIMFLCLELSILGLVLADLFRRQIGFGQTILFGTVFMLLLGLAFLFFVAMTRGMGPSEMISGYLEAHLKAALGAYEEMGVAQKNAAEFEAYAKAVVEIISKIYPSLMIIGTGVAVWLNVVIARPLFRIGGIEYPGFEPMDRWKTPDPLVWVMIVSGFALFLSSGNIKWIAINALIVMMAIYMFHGLSIVLFFLNKYRVPSWVRIGVFFLLIVQQIFLALLILGGIFDQWIDFRKIHRRMDS